MFFFGCVYYTPKSLRKLVFFNINSSVIINLFNRLFNDFLCGGTDTLKKYKNNQQSNGLYNHIIKTDKLITGLVDLFKSSSIIDLILLNLPFFLYILLLFIMLLILWFFYATCFSWGRLKEIKSLTYKSNLYKTIYTTL